MLEKVLFCLCGLFVGITIGIFVDKLIIKLNGKKTIGCEELLIKTFGKPVCLDYFSIDDVKALANNKDNEDITEFSFVEVNSDFLSKICFYGEMPIDKFVICTIFAGSKIKKRFLIKAKKVDEKLITEFDKGNGTFIIVR